MTKGEKIEEIYEGMQKNYEKLEKVMSHLYEHIQENSTDEESKNMLLELGTIGENMIESQMNLVKFSDEISEENRNFLINVLENKKASLSKAIEDTKTISITPQTR